MIIIDTNDKKRFPYEYIILGVLVLAIFISTFGDSFRKKEAISFSEFSTYLANNEIEEISVYGNGISIEALTSDGMVIKTNNPNTEESNNLIYNSGIVVDQEPIYPPKKTSVWSFLLTGGTIFVIFMLLKGSVSVSVGERIAGGIDTEDKTSEITFEDVAGSEDSKEAMKELAFYLKNPDKYIKYGVKAPKGAILYGPPGTGKTLLAKALANESECSFISVTGSDFVDKFVGNGASRVRRLFEEARKRKPCIIFIDEIDSVGGDRDDASSHEERKQTLNQLLSAMDGFQDDDGVIVIGATNRLESLDNALLRSGRFDTKVYIGLPDMKARKKIFQVHAKNKPVSDDVDFMALAKMTTHFSGADIENVMNKAGFYAAKEDSDCITMQHIDKAINHLIAGDEKKDRTGISEKDKWLTAYHEAGHALVAKLLAKISVPRITIIPTTHGAGGYTLISDEEYAYKSKLDLENDIAIALGGRAAEEIIYGKSHVTTGASSDIQKVTQLAQNMICRYGMSDKYGLIAIDTTRGTSKDILEDSASFIQEVYSKTITFLEKNREKLDNLANALMDREVILESEFENILKPNTQLSLLKEKEQ